MRESTYSLFIDGKEVESGINDPAKAIELFKQATDNFNATFTDSVEMVEQRVVGRASRGVQVQALRISKLKGKKRGPRKPRATAAVSA